MQFIPNAFYTRRDVVVVGSNMESADIDNPRGLEYGMREYVVVSNAYGDTYELPVEKNAEQLAQRLMARWTNFKKLPVNFTEWTQSRPIYGSNAYLDYGADDDLIWERNSEQDFT